MELKDLKNGEFTIQVGAFEDRLNARRLADRLRVIFDYVRINKFINKDNITLFKVHISKSKTLSQAVEIEKRLGEMGFIEAFIVRI